MTDSLSGANEGGQGTPPKIIGWDAARLRAEVEKTQDRSRQARLLGELGELAEQGGDEVTAARDYLAAFNADSSFREPLEGLVRLLERRRSLKNLGRVIDAIAKAAVTPQETARALLMRAAFLEDVQVDVPGALQAAREAAAIDLQSSEASSAEIALEMLGARIPDPAMREEALSRRAERTKTPTWQGLLLIDVARLALANGETDRAIDLLVRARSLGAGATFAALLATEIAARSDPGIPGSDEARARADAYSAAVEGQAMLIHEAITNPERGDLLGVPRWMRVPAYMIDAWLRGAEIHRSQGDLGGASSLLDKALEVGKEEEPIVLAALFSARIRIAELMGQTDLASSLAERRLLTEKDAGVAAALAMRMAEHAAGQGDATRALEALSRAAESDPTCAPARALQLDLLADAPVASAFPAQLEALSDYFESDEAKARAFLLAAYYWALRADDVDAAKAALSQAAMYGTPPQTISRLARTFASLRQDGAWYDEATRRLIASGAPPGEIPHLWFELVRTRLARGDAEGARKALTELSAAPGGEWLGRALDAFLPNDKTGSRAAALDQLAALEPANDMARALRFVGALAAQGDARRERLRELATESPDSALLAAAQIEADRLAGDNANAAAGAERAAKGTTDAMLSASFHLETAFSKWQGGDRAGALQALQVAAETAPEAVKVVHGWAARAQKGDTIEAKRDAIQRALDSGGDPHLLALERFAIEIAGGDAGDAAQALALLESEADGDRAMAAAVGRLIWPEGSTDPQGLRGAIARIGAAGAKGAAFAAAEKLRINRDDDYEEAADAAQAWFDAGGGTASALEWLVAVRRLGQLSRELGAMRALAGSVGGAEGEALNAGAAMRAYVATEELSPLLGGDTPATRLANLELAPPGCDPRRRAAALTRAEDLLGEDARIDALAMAGWSLLAAGNMDAAIDAFRIVAGARPDDIASVEGLRTAGEATNNLMLQAEAAEVLGTRCADPERAAAFWEEAANLWLGAGEMESAEAAFEQAFTRDPKRASAFDKLFRRVRDRKDNARLLELINQRLGHAEDPAEVLKLYWEQARCLRETGDQDGALEALEHVTMLEPEHVGALALSGEIFIRRARYVEAALKLSTLARLESAPPKNRLTAGVAAVDLYENKLNAHEKATDVLIVLHRAKLSTLPVRERLAKSAARTGKWEEATEILQQLMNERQDANGRIEAARLAIAIHRDKLKVLAGARAAAVKLLSEAPGDPEALDVMLSIDAPEKRSLLERGKQTLLTATQTQEPSADAALRIARIAGALGDSALEQAAAGVAVALGRTEASGRVAELGSKKPRAPQVRLPQELAKRITPPFDDGPIAMLFSLLGPTLREALGPSLEALGVGKRDRVDPRSGLALRNEIAAWAGAFGIDEFDLYVGGRDALGIQGVPGETHAIVVGAQVNSPLGPLLRARIARELWSIVRGTTVLRWRDETSVAAIVVAACRVCEVPIQAPTYAVLAEIEKQMKSAIARKTRNAAREVCGAIASSRLDAIAWSRAALMSQARIATIASGDLACVLAEHGIGANDPRTAQLARFVLSPDFVEIRRALGLEGS